jgi:DNA-binding NarL/FixJ family response regulator
MTPTDETHDFTDQELKVIFGVCSGLGFKEMAQQYGIAHEIVKMSLISIFDKAGFATRFELVEFAKTALNGELRRRRTKK